MLAAKYHDVNVLVNNAGVHNECSFKNGIEDFSKLRKEIETNFIAPVMLAEKFIPLLISHERAAIINITSYFGISPKPSAPIYSATKAAMRSFFVEGMRLVGKGKHGFPAIDVSKQAMIWDGSTQPLLEQDIPLKYWPFPDTPRIP